MKKFLYSMLLGTAMFSAVSCGEFGDINVDPNNPAVVPPSYLIVSAEKALMDDSWDEWMNGRFGLLYAQYWAQKQYSEESQYQYRSGTVNNYWTFLYSRSLADLDEIIRLNTEAPTPQSPNQIAIAKILRVYAFQQITDVWGDVPYSQALKPAEFSTPAYDKQSDIYTGLLAELDAAIAGIDISAGAFGANDNIYGSDMTAWKKFANSLKMRVGMRMADANPTAAKAAVEAAAAGAFTSNDDNALFRYLGAAPNNNPLNQDRIERGDADFAFSKTLCDTLKGIADPRLTYFADPNEDGDYNGMPYGLLPPDAAAIPATSVAKPSGARAVNGLTAMRATDVLAPEAPATLMDYAEVEFIMAEAVARGWNVGGSEKSHYNAGITASMDFWSQGAVTAGEVATYLAQPTVDYDQIAGDYKHKIGFQKWIALYMQGVQGWAEWRRLDFGTLVQPTSNFEPAGCIPTRWPYPTNEQTLNKANYSAAVSSQGTDDQCTKLWWDKN